MSTIRVDNFGPSAGGTTYSARGIAKAWVNFNGTGTIAARDSENVSSLTDNGTGNYTVNFSNAFGAADWAATGNSNVNNAGHTTIPREGQNVFVNSVGIVTLDGVNGADAPTVSLVAHGDLA